MPKDCNDITYNSVCAYGSTQWVCSRLGRSDDWFLKHRKDLMKAGFPKPDEITGHWIKKDVDAWIDRRRQIPDTPIVEIGNLDVTSGVNLDEV